MPARKRPRSHGIGARAGASSCPLPCSCEQSGSARWGGAQASRRPTQGAERQRHGTRCLEGHHASGSQRVHLLGRGCQAEDDARTPHSPDPGGTGGRPAPALLLARVHTPRAHRQIAVGAAHSRAGRSPPSVIKGSSATCVNADHWKRMRPASTGSTAAIANVGSSTSAKA
jgi:hypothetical protein